MKNTSFCNFCGEKLIVYEYYENEYSGSYNPFTGKSKGRRKVQITKCPLAVESYWDGQYIVNDHYYHVKEYYE